jgi:hypothetical protein
MFSKFFGRKAPDQPLSPDRFADRYVAFVKARVPEVTVARQGDGVTLTWPDGGTMSQFLANARASYRDDPEAIEAIFDAQLASALAARGGSDALDASLVLPVIKTTAWLEASAAQLGEAQTPSNPRAMVVEPLAGDLILAYAQDLPASIQYVKHGDLDGGLDPAALRSLAFANLATRAADLTIAGGGGRYRVELDGFFDTSLMLMAETWLDRVDLAGDPVFAAPCREQLMVCGADDARAVAELADICVQIAADSAYALSTKLFVLRGGRLEVL